MNATEFVLRAQELQIRLEARDRKAWGPSPVPESLRNRFCHALETLPGWFCDTCSVGELTQGDEPPTRNYLAHEKSAEHIKMLRRLGY